MALIADLLIAAALLAAVVIGARRGLLRSLTGLVVVVLAFVLASWAADRLADPVAQKLSPLVERRIEQKLTQQESASVESVLADFGFIGERLQELTQQVVRAAQESGASLLAALSQSVAHSVAYTLVYVVSFVLLLLVLGLLSKPLQLVTKLPVIHGANAVGGGALGLLWRRAGRCSWSCGRCVNLIFCLPRRRWSSPDCCAFSPSTARWTGFPVSDAIKIPIG